jgi:hypothetical protein
VSRGSAVVESLLVGTVAVALALTSVIGALRIQAAGERAEEAARVAADTAARWGGPNDGAAAARRLVPGAEVIVWRSGDRIVATVHMGVSIVGPAGSAFSTTVTGRAESRIAPHRSGR